MRKTVTIIKDKMYLTDTKSKKASRRENRTEQVFLNNQWESFPEINEDLYLPIQMEYRVLGQIKPEQPILRDTLINLWEF